MFIWVKVEIRIKDRTAYGLDDHDTKLWIHRVFNNLSCYRVSEFSRVDAKLVRATLWLKVSAFEADKRRLLEVGPDDQNLLRRCAESLFVGKGQLRCIGRLKLVQE